MTAEAAGMTTSTGESERGDAGGGCDDDDGTARVGEKRKKKGERSKGSGHKHAQSTGMRERARDEARGQGD